MRIRAPFGQSPPKLGLKMAVLAAANIGVKISSGFRLRSISVPRVYRNKVAFCLKGKEFSSSVPVRYIPKKSSKPKEPENLQPPKDLRKNVSLDSLGSSGLKNVACSSSIPDRYETKKHLVAYESLKDSRRSESCDSLESNELKDGEFSSSFPSRNAPEKSSKANGSKKFQPLKSLRENESRESLDLNELKGGGFSSSLPIRYSPEKYSKPNGSVYPKPLKSLWKNEPRSSLDLSAFGIKVVNNGNGVGESIVLVESTQRENRARKKNVLHSGAKQEEENVDDMAVMGDETMEEPGDMVQEIPMNKRYAEKEMQDAEKYAVKLLASRAFTAVELRKKLQGKKFPSNIAEAVILNFQSRGLINDGLYAETYSRSRFSSSSWGPRRIKQGLFQKGISGREADNAVRMVFEEGKSSDDSESNLGMSKLSMDHLLVQASKQWLRGLDAPKETRKSRIIRWLQYRGFSWGVIGLVLKKLECQYPT